MRLTIVALALAVALPARAGVVLEYEDADHKPTRVELEGKKLRSSSEGDAPGRSTIFDGEKRVFYALDDREKSYRRLDEASASALGHGLQDAMEKAKARMTPEQRAQFEAAMAKAQRSPSAGATPKEHGFSFERVPGRQKVAGFDCDNYRVLRDGATENEACFVPWEAGVLKKADFVALTEMGHFFEKTLAAMSAGGGPGGAAGRDDWITRFVETAPGFPVVMVRLDKEGKRTHEMRLVKLERTSLAADRFVPPADYREKPAGLPGGNR